MPMLLGACTNEIVLSQKWTESPALPTNSEVVGSYWLPVAKFPVTVKRKNCELTVEIGDASFFPDPAHHYTAIFQRDAFTADDVVLETDDAGLLQSVNASSEPQQAAIVGKLFEIGANIVKVASGAAGTMALTGKAPVYCNPDEETDVTYTIDPMSASADSDLTTVLPEGIEAHVSATPLVATDGKAANDPCATQTSGVCYRPAWPFRIEITLEQHVLDIVKNKKGKIVSRTDRTITVKRVAAAVIPNPNVIQQVTLNRNGPAKTDIKLGFSHGVLTKYENNRPSTALAVIGIPADILKGVLGHPPSSSSAGGESGDGK
ncbi:MAG TPA: hypothetical protein VGC36_11105 [Rhizomicrobium sp.]